MVANLTAIDTTRVSRGNNRSGNTGTTTEPVSLTIKGQRLSRQQLELAYVQLSKDGKNYIITPKKDVPVEILKETFGIEDGAFREILKKQYQEGTDNGVFVEQYSRFFGLSTGTRFNYSRALLYSDQTYKIPLDKLKSQR